MGGGITYGIVGYENCFEPFASTLRFSTSKFIIPKIPLLVATTTTSTWQKSISPLQCHFHCENPCSSPKWFPDIYKCPVDNCQLPYLNYIKSHHLNLTDKQLMSLDKFVINKQIHFCYN